MQETENKKEITAASQKQAAENTAETAENMPRETEPTGKRAFAKAFKVAFPRTIPVLTG